MMNLVFLHGLLGTKSDWQKVIENLPHLRLRGLMAIPAPTDNIAEQEAVFSQMEKLFEQLKAAFPHQQLIRFQWE